MRILQIAPQIPYPLSDGGKVGIFNITKHLALRGHKITLLAFDRDGLVDVTPLQTFCELITIRRSTENSKVGAFFNLFSSTPYNISKYRSRKFHAALSKLLACRRFDVVHVDHLHMAHYGVLCKSVADLPFVLREHNVESAIMERFLARLGSDLFRRYVDSQLAQLRNYEAEMLLKVDCCCAITGADAERIHMLQPSAEVSVIPGGVDSAFFEPPTSQEKIPASIVFFGSWDWIPNQDAVRWFLESIFPLVKRRCPRATLFIMGKKPPEDIQSLRSDSVIITGFVPDLKREVQRCQVAIAPYRIGGGLRFKILESFAMRVPVVSTTVGCEGIEAEHQKHLLIKDSPEGFAQAIVRLFEDHVLHESLVTQAYALAAEKYQWGSVAEKFELVYHRAVDKKKQEMIQ